MAESNYEKTVLPGGLRVLSRCHPQVHSVTIGLWVMAGSVYERPEEQGLAHLLEHMVFKGTKGRSMFQIAAAMDDMGGQLNAFTEREHVCYHARVLTEHTARTLQLLSDLVTSPRLSAADLELERTVVLEEIRALDDTPEDLVEELFATTIWEKSPWGRSVLGSVGSIEHMTTRHLQAFMQRLYIAPRILVVAVGAVRHDRLVQQVEKYLAPRLPSGHSAPGRLPPRPRVRAHHVVASRSTEQLHICCGTRAYGVDDPRRYVSYLLDVALTGGYSSRLFQEVREKRGLCYHISPLSACYRTGGFWAVETAVAPAVAGTVMKIISRELRRVKQQGLTSTELRRAQRLARAAILLAEESMSSQMSRLAQHEIYYGRLRDIDDLLAEISAITLDDVQRVANEMFVDNLMNVAAVGPIASDELPGVEVGT